MKIFLASPRSPSSSRLTTLPTLPTWPTSPTSQSRRRFGLSLALLPVALAGGCGFKIRGANLGLPFERILVQGEGVVANEVRWILQGQPTMKIVQKSVDAQVVLNLMSERTERTVVAFSSAGRPREIQLRLRAMYRVTDGYAVEITPPAEVTVTRDISVTESEALSITSAEDAMQVDMRRDIAQQIVRRLRAIKLPAP
jgi:LPS-assembly lipoprotein